MDLSDESLVPARIAGDAAGDAAGAVTVVLNAGSGRSDTDERIATIERVLQAGGRRFTLHAVRGGEALMAVAQRAVAAAAPGDTVVAAGGDGTIATVAQAVLGAPLRFGVIPQGTFNYFARAQGIDQDTEAATRVLLQGRERLVQAGLLNGRVFLVNASVGLYPQLLADRERWKRELGRSRLVALWAAIVTLVKADPRLHLRLVRGAQDALVHTSTLVVGNNPLQLEQIGVDAGTAFDDGMLVAMTARPVDALGRLRLLARAAIGRLGDAPEVDAFAFASLQVRPARIVGRRTLRVALDGEVTRMATPLRFEVAPQRLRLLVP